MSLSKTQRPGSLLLVYSGIFGKLVILFMSVLTFFREFALLSIESKFTFEHALYIYYTSTETKYTHLDTGLTRNTATNIYNSTVDVFKIVHIVRQKTNLTWN